MNQRLQTLTLFCRVVDNYGDIGICWRLARQLALEHHIGVTLWVDDLLSFQRICPQVAIDQESQQIGDIRIRHWRDQDGVFSRDDISDIVIEFFGCELPPAYIAAMAQCQPQPVWLNLEGLSAEEWVEGCHTLSSPHPSLSLTKYFYFPGFTNKTGGLLLEADLLQQRSQFQQNQAEQAQFLNQLGVTESELAATKVSLFCYPQAPVHELFTVWQNSSSPVTCLVAQGVASAALAAFFGSAIPVGSSCTRGALTVRVIPFVAQPDYDKLLWACDFNFVRGEDSFVRALWAARPFVWHIYPQDNNLHHVKLKAFLARYVDKTDAKADSLVEFFLGWNAASNTTLDFNAAWKQIQAELQNGIASAIKWQQQQQLNGDLASNLLAFSETVRKKTPN